LVDVEGRYYRKSPGRFSLRKHLRNRWLLLGILVGLPLMLYVFFGSHGLLQRFRLEQEKSDLEAKIIVAEKENERLGIEAKALDTDLNVIEKVAREKYGMAREGETVYRILEKTGDAGPQPKRGNRTNEGAKRKNADAPNRNAGSE
jgi:cell division protein FtsB